jgi:hypothetical protein
VGGDAFVVAALAGEEFALFLRVGRWLVGVVVGERLLGVKGLQGRGKGCEGGVLTASL